MSGIIWKGNRWGYIEMKYAFTWFMVYKHTEIWQFNSEREKNMRIKKQNISNSDLLTLISKHRLPIMGFSALYIYLFHEYLTLFHSYRPFLILQEWIRGFGYIGVDIFSFFPVWDWYIRYKNPIWLGIIIEDLEDWLFHGLLWR